MSVDWGAGVAFGIIVSCLTVCYLASLVLLPRRPPRRRGKDDTDGS